jgi:hypothetical protein
VLPWAPGLIGTSAALVAMHAELRRMVFRSYGRHSSNRESADRENYGNELTHSPFLSGPSARVGPLVPSPTFLDYGQSTQPQ